MPNRGAKDRGAKDRGAGDDADEGLSTTTLVEGLAFPEGPRWHDGRLFFSDMHNLHVKALDLDGRVEIVAKVPGQPSGLGWLANGDLLIVSMTDRRLLRKPADSPGEPGGLGEVANLEKLASWHCNDMVVDDEGRAYVGNFGSELSGTQAPDPAALVLVEPEGEPRIVATDLAFPNGMVITPDGSTLIVAETFGQRLTAFDIDADGSLSHRRVWAQLEGALPDGICLDAEDAIWVASPLGVGGVLRVHEGGRISERVAVETAAYACMLGGAEGRTLFVCTASTHEPEKCRERRDGRIERVEVEIPGAGLP